MPYIKPEVRDLLDNKLNKLGNQIDNEGELNYCITYLCLKYIQTHNISYSVYNSIIGVLECSKLEIYKRHVSLYEDIKKVENGDVIIGPLNKERI